MMHGQRNIKLTRCSLRKPLSATAVRTGVTDIVTESRRLTSPSSIGSYRNEKRKVILVFHWG